MNRLPICTLYTCDEELATRVRGFLHQRARVRQIETPDRFSKICQQMAPGLLVLDAKAPYAIETMRGIAKRRPELLIVALCDPNSDPARELEDLGVYAIEMPACSRRRFQTIAIRAFDQLEMQAENMNLREQVSRDMPPIPPPTGLVRPGPQLPLHTFSRSLRHMNNLQALLESVVEGIAATSLVSRVGIFMRSRKDGVYRHAAGIRCLAESLAMEYAPGEDLVQWLESHACQVARSHLDHVADVQERWMLRQELDAAGAEVLIPLLGRQCLTGWLYIGVRSTGAPFSYADLEDFTILAEHVGVTLENALLYEEVADQKTMAETLLHSMPTGICAVDLDGRIRTLNQPAEQILGLVADQVLWQPAACLGSRMADVLLQCLEGVEREPGVWKDPRTHKVLRVEARPLRSDALCRGAVALIHDITNHERLKEKEEQVERASFWNDLAASMSHEIRNPLVAIKTFAQLLPDRYADAGFRADFSQLVTEEVDRLNGIIEQIDQFAHPADLEFSEVSLPETIQSGLDLAKSRVAANGMNIATAFDPDLPKVRGDRNALAQCFAHLIANAMEAVAEKPKAQIRLRAQREKSATSPDKVQIAVEDNGPGIPAEIQDKIFSPFCTTKTAGMGLGLPIVKRTVIDHNGEIQIESTHMGTRATISLQARQKRGET
jgi:PAS domain S-box-containing protein